MVAEGARWVKDDACVDAAHAIRDFFVDAFMVDDLISAFDFAIARRLIAIT